MKTLYLKTTMKLIRLLPVLIFFMLALSYNARSQFASPNPVCYGQPIYLFCSLSGCEVAGATYTWTNVSGSWISTDQNPIILPFTTGYAEDRFFLQVQFAPPPGGFSGGTVKVNLLPGVSVTGTATNILCYGLSTGSINITATGGNPPYTYLWSNGSVSKNQTGLAAGTYSVTVTDLSGCFNDTQSWTITQPSDLILTGVVSPVLCNGASTGSVDISVSGGTPGYGYLWSNGAVTQDIINLAAGVYTVTVSDANNCKKINSYTVTQSSAIILTGTPSPVLCNGGSSGSVDISVSGGVTPYGYLWSNGAVTEDISGLTAGTYTVTVTDANSCTTSNSWTVTQPSALSLTGTASPVLCFGGSTGAVDITVSGGTMPYGYMWSTGAITEDISGLTAGFYTVTVTDGNACTMMMSYEVTGPVAALNATASVTNIDCNGNHNGTINLTVTGGTPAYAYEWSNGSVTEDLTGLYPGTYTVTVTDANACFTTGSWMISEPSDISWYGSVTNVSCYGGSDGHIEGGADGGTPPYTYQWSTGATTQNIANLTAGTYTVTATDAVGCYTFTSRIIGQPSELVIAQQAVITDVSCNGGSDGAIDISVSGGTPAYTYMWSNGETSEDIGGLVAGMYVVTVTDANGCQNSAYWMVNEPAALSLTGQASPVLCNGGSTGSINISVSGGTPAYGYMWSNGAMTEDITGLTAGVYTVTITDANGCKISDFWTVAEPSALSLTGTATPALCNGGSSGTIDISVSGGTMPYGYLWSNGTMSEDVSGLAAGFYTVTVTDDNGCQISDTWQVTEPSALSLTGMASPVLCNGGSTGSVDITVTGGTMPYGYIWSNGESSEDISGLTAGTYSVVVTDANGCQIFDYWMVTEPSALSLTGTSTPVLCYGGTTGTIDITVSGGTMPYGYLWSNGAMTEDLSGLTGGVYTVTVTDGNACMITLDFTVSGPQEALLATAVVTNIDCNGNHNGTIDLTVSGGTPAYGYEWSNGAITEDLSGLFPGTYTVTVTDANACITTGSWMVSEPSDISWYGSVTNVSCYGGSDGFIEGSALGGTPPYTYLWSNGETTENIYNLTAGTYTVTPTDAAGCYTFTSRVIGQPFELLISQGTIVTNVSCFGGSNGAIDITVTGGTMPYGYMWSNSATTEDISGLIAGIYNVTVTDAHGCQTFGEWNVEEAPALTLTGTPTPVLCNQGSTGSIDLTVTGGTMPYGYMWSNGESSEDIGGLTAGTYTVTVTDANGCQKSDNWTVTEPSALSITGTPTHVLCNGGSTGSIDITVTGGTPDYTYAWTTGAGTEDIGGLTAGCYTVTVTDANQCTITGTWCITEPPALTLTGMGSPVLCNGGSSGSIDIMVAGGTMPYGYAWSNGETSEDIGGLTAGCYTVTVMDANSCMITDTWCITEPSALSLTGISTPALCNGGSAGSIDITVAGGTMPYGYMWSNGESSEDISGLTAGTYTVTVTDANACMTSMSFMVSEPTALDLTAVVSNIDCNGNHNGAIDLTVTGGTPAYGYVWSNGESTEDLTGLFPGTYTVTVTDANACISINSWMVSEPSDISWYGSVTNVSCYGGSDGYIEGSTSGGTPPYTYLWSNGETTENIYNLTAGTYTVTPTDAHGCYTFTSRVVGQPDELLISQGTVISNVSCFGGSNGAIDITVTGGTMPYGYMWSNGATSEDISGLIAGIYNVTVTDAHGCQTFGEWTVEEAPALSLTGIPTPVLCNGGSTGSIDLTVTGGTMPYGYMWSNGESSEDIGGLSAGTYTVTVTDANGCQKSDNWTVTEPSALSITGTPTHVLCNGGSTGSIDITVTGGTPDYTYAWTTGAGTEDIGGLTAGCYTVTVTDANQCTITGTWCITEPPALTLTGMGSPVLCNGGSSGSIDIMVAGGTMPYGYTWSNGETSEDIGGLTAGCYTVTVMDANSCMITDTWCITEPDPLVITTAVVTHVTCNGASNGAINGGYDIIGQPLPIGVSGGTPPYSFIWSDGTTNNSLCCVPAGCYTVTVTDANNCMTTGTWCITEPSALTLTGTPSPVLCYGGSGGAIDITVTGGTPDYTYLWSNGVTDEDVSGLTAGTYTVTVTDANGCPITNSWTVTQPTELTVTGIAYPVLCNGGSSGMIDITVSGGTMPYAYFWSNGATSEDLSGLIAGTYTVIVYDDNECMATGSWTITEPSALSLEATVTSVTCYTGSTGAIDLTVMGGTPPYGYAWSNGAITEDISGLTAGTYTVTVTDANLCVATSSWMVSEPPMWSVGITGPTAACCNEPGVDDYYANVGGFLGYVPGTMIPCTPADITYEWVVVGGTITSGWNTSHITVDWECCTIGTVTVTATKCDGCFLSTTLNVAVSLPPAPVITGPATVYSNGTDTYCALPEIPGHLYSWTVINGSYTTIPGTNCITVTWNSYPACGCAMVIVCETDPITGCTGCDTLYVTMLPDPLGISLSGTVSYKNGLPNTPLNGVTIKLRDLTSGLIIATTVSGPNMNPPLYTGDPGYYAFTNVPSGNYRLESSFNGTWGGNNATDALLIQLEAGSIPGTYLSGLFRIVADVNASLTVTALDALYVKLRTVGSINSYPAGDWKFEQPTISTLPAVVDFAGLCVGDVNGSYIPTGLKAVSFLSVVDDETQTIPVEETFTYEIRSNMVAQLGAMTLFMGYNNDLFEVIDVTASSNNDEMKYVIEDGNVAIAWADTRPMSVRNSDQIFTLTVKAKAPVAEATQIFDVRTGSEFASPTGIRYDNFDLKMSKVITMGGSKEFAMFNYPNPFANSTKIVYTLPESGNVTLVITDMFGKTVRTLVDDFQVAGTYSIPVVAADLNLSSGVYLYRIEATGVTDTYVKVNKMIFAR